MTAVRGVPVDYTDVGYEALRASMLEIARQTLPEWTDHSDNDVGVLLVELMAYAADLTLYYQDRIAAQLFPSTVDEPEALVQLLRLIGYERRPPSPATADLELAVDAAAPRPLTLPARTAFTATAPDGTQVRFETGQPLTLTATDLGPVEAGGVRRWTPLAVSEGRSVVGEVVGAADGSAGQMYVLAGAPVAPGTIEVAVAEPGGTTLWREVPTLAACSPASRAFVVQRAADGATTLVFGDGVNGRVPVRGAAATPAHVTATYRVGGGAHGNLAAGTRLTTGVPGVRYAVAAAGSSGGAVAEDLDRARRLAPRLFRTQERAVTAGDHADLALATPGVGKALAVAAGWNDIDLYVAPSGRVAAPSELLRRDLLAAFEQTRMTAAVVHVKAPHVVDVFLRADVRAEPQYRQQEVRAAVEEAVGALLSFDAVDFGQAVYLSRVYDAAQSLPQVQSLTVTQFSRDPAGGVDADGVIELSPFELARPGRQPAVAVTVTGGVP